MIESTTGMIQAFAGVLYAHLHNAFHLAAAVFYSRQMFLVGSGASFIDGVPATATALEIPKGKNLSLLLVGVLWLKPTPHSNLTDNRSLRGQLRQHLHC